MIPLTNKEILSLMKNKKYVIYVKKGGFEMMIKTKKKVRDHYHHTGKFRGAAHSECNLRYNASKEFPIIIHNAGYDTHFIINQLAIEFDGEINCIGDNMENYITFSVPTKREVINNNVDKKTITRKLKFIDSYRFMQSLLLVTHLKFLKVENVDHAKKEQKLIQNVVLLD